MKIFYESGEFVVIQNMDSHIDICNIPCLRLFSNKMQYLIRSVRKLEIIRLVSKRWNKHLHRTQCREYANCTQTGIAHKKLHRRFCLLICVFAFIHVFAHLILLLLFNRSSNVKRRWMCSTFIESCYKCHFPLEGWQFKYLHRNWHCIARNSFFSRLRFTFNLIYAYRLIR